jgi:alcohol dehydrogenase (NADP+)
LIQRNLGLVGAPAEPSPLDVFGLLFARRNISGSIVGGIRETQGMLDFCGEHNVTADIEMIGMQQINQAYDRLLKNDVKYRFVIDMASLR